jgi:hypothetical protein
MTSQRRVTPRADYRRQEVLRSKASASLAATYPNLKSLTVEFGHYTSEGLGRNHQIKYTVNPEHARTVFCLDCPNLECIRGDFDLSSVIAEAVSLGLPMASGEISCQGWLTRHTIDKIPCHQLLRYKLLFEYQIPPPKIRPVAQSHATC